MSFISVNAFDTNESMANDYKVACFKVRYNKQTIKQHNVNSLIMSKKI
jgi:succinylarginine dihydrolase